MENLTDEQKMAIKEKEEIEKANREEIRQLMAEGKLPQIRPLTRKERKAMDAAGVNMGKIRMDEKRSFAEVRDQMYDWILDNVYKNFDFDEIDNAVCNSFALFTYKISIQDNIAAKNF